MSNFLYGFPDHMAFNAAVGPTRPRDSLSLHDSRQHHPLHHHPQHHPHLVIRSSTTPSPPRLLPVSSTMAPLLERPSLQHPQQVLASAPHSPASDFAHSSMKSFLHVDAGDTVLFKSWVLNSTWDIVLTCLAFLLLAILYEGIKCYREHLFKRLSFAVKKQVPVLSSMHHPHHHVHHQTLGSSHAGRQRESSCPPEAPAFNLRKSNFNLRILSLPHTIQSLLHVLQTLLSYTLMLAFMTFNLYICLSIILGAGIGYFMFYWRKITVVHVTDCH